MENGIQRDRFIIHRYIDSNFASIISTDDEQFIYDKRNI